MFPFGIQLRCFVWSGVNGGSKWTGRAAGGVCKAWTHGAPALFLQHQVCRERERDHIACHGMAYHDTLRRRECYKRHIDMANDADLPWPESLLRKSLLKLMRQLLGQFFGGAKEHSKSVVPQEPVFFVINQLVSACKNVTCTDIHNTSSQLTIFVWASEDIHVFWVWTRRRAGIADQQML